MALSVLRVEKDHHSDAKFNASQSGVTLQEYIQGLIDADTKLQGRTPLSEQEKKSN